MNSIKIHLCSLHHFLVLKAKEWSHSAVHYKNLLSPTKVSRDHFKKALTELNSSRVRSDFSLNTTHKEGLNKCLQQCVKYRRFQVWKKHNWCYSHCDLNTAEHNRSLLTDVVLNLFVFWEEYNSFWRTVILSVFLIIFSVGRGGAVAKTSQSEMVKCKGQVQTMAWTSDTNITKNNFANYRLKCEAPGQKGPLRADQLWITTTGTMWWVCNELSLQGRCRTP